MAFSPEATALIQQLLRARSGTKPSLAADLRNLIRPRTWRLDVMRKLAALNEPATAPWILAVYVRERDLLAADVAPLLEPLVRQLSIKELIDIARGSGEYSSWYYWNTTEDPRERLRQFVGVPGGWSAFALASLARSGHVREQAIRALDELLRDGREVPFLILRTADYVAQVRHAATAAVSSRLTAEHAPFFVLSLPLLRHLDESRVRKEATVLQWVKTVLLSKRGWPALEAGLHSPDRDVRRECFALAFSIPARRDEIGRKALNDLDPLLRLRGLRELGADAGKDELVLAGLRDPYAPVRAAALGALATADDATAANVWRGALLDRSASIREMARRWFAAHEPIDAAAFYRSELEKHESATLAQAVAGLAEIGTDADAADLLFLTEHPRAKVREAVAAGVGRLLGAEANDAVIPMLRDESGRVARKAGQVLRRHLTTAIARSIWGTIDELKPAGAVAAVRLLADLPKWEALDYLLRALDKAEPIRSAALALLDRWVRVSVKSGRALSAGDASRLRERLGQLPFLPQALSRKIDFDLQYWQREGK